MSLVLEGVSKVMNGQTQIYATDLTLETGTMNVLLGPTSSGKTSLMRLMAGLDVPNTGRVIWNGKDVTRIPPMHSLLRFSYRLEVDRARKIISKKSHFMTI